jgi:hypothetical protein
MNSRDEKDDYSGADAMYCDFMDIEDSVERAFATGKTPIISDTSSDDKVCTFYSYQSNTTILDIKPIIVISSQNMLKAMDMARKHLVNAMKFGKTLIIRMDTAAPDFRNNFNDDSFQQKPSYDGQHYFPSCAILEGGR